MQQENTFYLSMSGDNTTFILLLIPLETDAHNSNLETGDFFFPELAPFYIIIILKTFVAKSSIVW